MTQHQRITAAILPGGSACPNLSQALAAARDKCGGAVKQGKVAFGATNYAYATSDEAIAVASEALRGSGLAIIPVSEELTVINAGANTFYALNRTLILSHASGEFTPLEVRGWPVIQERGKGLDKAYATALTGSLAYKLRDLLQMPRGDKFADDMNQRDDREHVPEAPAKPTPAGAKKLLQDAGLPVKYGSQIEQPVAGEIPAVDAISSDQLIDLMAHLCGEWKPLQGFLDAYEIGDPADLPAPRASEAIRMLKLIGDIEEHACAKGVSLEDVLAKCGEPSSLFLLDTKTLTALRNGLKNAKPREIPV